VSIASSAIVAYNVYTLIHSQYATYNEVSIMETTKVGIREFRADLAEYIASSTPVAVTRHGQTVGYFIPTQGQIDADIAAMKKASKILDQVLAAQDVDIDSVVADFKVARKQPGPLKKPRSKTV
jgi:antitoxin (DNA-binding transcriptional repressor) of toxin-antitoxin stability system